MLKSRNLFRIIHFLLFSISIQICSGQEIVVNEYYNTASQNDEWTELIVVKDNLNLTGWFLGDNLATTTSWQPKIKFKANALWKNLRAGTVIIIDHAASGGECDDVTDVDKSDGFIRVCCRNSNYFEGGSTTTLFLADAGDFVHIVDPTGKMIHGIGHDDNPGSSVLGGTCFTASDNWTNTTSARAATRPCGNFTFYKFAMSAPTSLKMIAGTTADFSSGMQVSSTNPFVDTSDIPKEGIGNGFANDQWLIDLRAPEITSQNVCRLKEANGNISFSWVAATDSFPSDNTIGYLVIRNSTGNFPIPAQGVQYALNATFGTGNQQAKVVGIINNSAITTFQDNPGPGSFYYRVFSFRYKNTIGFQHPTRGRIYNQTDFISVQNNPFAVDAGSDKTVCGQLTNLEATPPQVGIGFWTLVSGSGNIGNSLSSQSSVSNLGIGANTFAWNVTVGSCTSEDQVVVFRESNPLNLGQDTALCIGSVYTLSAGSGHSSYLWSNNQTDTSISITSPGQYWVQIVANNGCIFRDSVNLNFVICSGVRPNSLQKPKFEVFPNPSNGEFNLLFDAVSNEDLPISIKDFHGRILFYENLSIQNAKTLKSIHLREYSTGLYFLEIGNGIRKSSAKLIVE